MTTFKMFLSESDEQTEVFDDVKSFAKAIKSQCSEYLSLHEKSIISSSGIWRGIRQESMPKTNKFSIVPRGDRIPMSMPTPLHDAANAFFSEKFNFKYRSAAVFCSQKKMNARSYGNTAFIFPVDGYTLCASNMVYDLYELLDDTFAPYVNNIGEILKFLNDPTDDNEKEDFTRYMRLVKTGHEKDLAPLNKFLDFVEYFETKNLNDIYTYSEIMLKCKKYFGIMDERIPAISSQHESDFDSLISEIYDI